MLTAVRPPELLRRGMQVTYQPAIRLDEVLTLEGERLPTSEGVALEVRSPVWEPGSAQISGVQPGPRPGTLQVALPATLAAPLVWSPGIYTAALRVPSPAGPDAVSNAAPFALAPAVQISPTSATPGAVELTVQSVPPPHEEQTVLLLLSGLEPLAPTTIAPPTFTAPDLTAGEYLVRLRVDGVDSLPYQVVQLPGGGTALDHAPSDVLVVS